MRRYIRDLRPTSVYDLAAMVALYRPGPMDNIPAYIRRKHGQEPVTYLHPLLEPYLEKTYGIFVYQEDIMSAAIALGGFTGPEADTLGYAIRKKKSAVLRAQKEKFVTQAGRARRRAPDVIDAVFKAFEPFERYGFNKAHATCYGLIAYQTAYLKANHTVDYMTAVLTAFRANEEKVAAAVAECRRMGIEVLPPDVHRSHLEFTVEGDAIRFGLLAVKNVGQGAIESIIAARDEGGPFRSLTDFCTRIDLRLANRKVLEALAKVGALERVRAPGPDPARARRRRRWPRRRPSATGSPARPRCSTSARPTPHVFERPLPAATEAPVRERLRWEKELLGLYLSEHPMGEVAEQVGAFVNAYSGDLKDESLDGQRVVVGGIVTGRPDRHHQAPRQSMAIVTLEDLQGSIEVVVFPRLYETTRATWRDGAILLVAGPGRPQGRGGLAARRPRRGLGRRGPAAGPRRSRARSRPATGLRRAANGNGRPAGRSAWDRGGGSGPGPGGAPVMAPVGRPRSAVAAGAPIPAYRRSPAPPIQARPCRRSAPLDPVPTYVDGARPSVGDTSDDDDEPAVPDEARARIVADATADTATVGRPGHRPARPVRGRRPPRIAWSARWSSSRPCCATGPERRAWSSTSRHPAAAMLCRWSCAAAWPTTRSCVAEVRRRLGDGVVDLRLASA